MNEIDQPEERAGLDIYLKVELPSLALPPVSHPALPLLSLILPSAPSKWNGCAATQLKT